MSNRFGVDIAPSGTIRAALEQARGLWVYDQRAKDSQIREQSQRLRNLADELLAQYSRDLRQTLADLRRALPEPTRDHPDADPRQLASIAELDRFIHSVEDVRVAISGLPVPDKGIVWRSRAEHIAFLDRLRSLDLELFSELMAPDEDVLERVRAIVSRRKGLFQDYVAWGL
ncbi:MAG: hypothetical protein OWU32_02750 [Firmicutes bacterium]|nr:hypothetical protein [Bacillota bacterium]